MNAGTAGLQTLKKDGLQYLSSPALSAFEETSHAFLTRAGGVSPAPFASLNMSARGGDAPENVEQNFALLRSGFGISRGDLFKIDQVHGNDVVVVEDYADTDAPQADAAVTALKGTAVGVLTADCLPVLLYDPVNKVVAAVHAGWRGTAKEISVRAVEVMRERFGSSPAEIRAALGPSIGPCCYTVGPDVAQIFSSTKALIYDGQGARLDLAEANAVQLAAVGLAQGNVTRSNACTSCANGLFFSYRKEGARTGRQLSFITLRG